MKKILLLIAVLFSTANLYAQDNYHCQLLDATLTAPNAYELVPELTYSDKDSTLLIKEGVICISKQVNGLLVSVMTHYTADSIRLEDYHKKTIASGTSVMYAREYKLSKENNEGVIDLEGKQVAKYYAKFSSLSPSNPPVYMETYSLMHDGIAWSLILTYDNRFTKKPLYKACLQAIKSLK